MVSGNLFQTFLDRLEEARLYREQGLDDGIRELLTELLDDLENSLLSEDEKGELRSRIQEELEKLGERKKHEAEGAQFRNPLVAHGDPPVDPRRSFEYAMALTDGQFWEEAIGEFEHAAAGGYRVMQCWELCGDCAGRLGKWDDAIRYYEIVYADPDVDEEPKKQILIKITRCSQTRKEIVAVSSIRTREGNNREKTAWSKEKTTSGEARAASSIGDSMDHCSLSQLVGSCIESWENGRGEYLAGRRQSYTVLNLLHVGISSLVLELENEGDGRRCAGQVLTAPFARGLSPEALFTWGKAIIMTNSQHLARVFDLLRTEDHYCVVREYYALSLADLLAGNELMPVPLAIHFAHQILEGLGDLHLHMGRDEKIRNIYHLDLRPSRVLLHGTRPHLRLNNGGLWREIEKHNPVGTHIRHLPLAFLSYRAPEQFRTYLARKRPPVFTDIYQFGTLFYEMLTGCRAFNASSFEEFEIQHCEQYPTPPKVWRPEIPEELNVVIMRCLECDPLRRWRSATQISLELEKTYSTCIGRVQDRIYSGYIERLQAQ